jgi:hypothetical protein
MDHFLQGDSGKTILALVSVISVCGGPLILAGWALWLKYRKNERNAELKQQMLERGMSAEEIVRVLNAGTHSWASTPRASAPPPKDRSGV